MSRSMHVRFLECSCFEAQTFLEGKKHQHNKPFGDPKKKIVDSWYIPKWPKKDNTFLIQNASILAKVTGVIGVTKTNLRSFSGGWLDLFGGSIESRWLPRSESSSDPVGFSLEKTRGFLQEITHFGLPTRGIRGEFGARNENHVSKKVANFSKKWRKTCFLCWWFSGSCIFVAGGWSFYGWSLSFSTGAYFCGHYWALMGLAHQTIEHGHLKKMPWKDTFFFPSFFLSDTLNIRSIPQIYRVEVSFQLNVVVSWIRTRPRGGYWILERTVVSKQRGLQVVLHRLFCFFCPFS